MSQLASDFDLLIMRRPKWLGVDLADIPLLVANAPAIPNALLARLFDTRSFAPLRLVIRVH